MFLRCDLCLAGWLVFLLFSLLVPVSAPLHAQGVGSSTAETATEAQGTLPNYDVSTVKLNTSDSGNSSFNWTDRSIVITNTSLKDLLQGAFNVKPNMVFGLPPWAEKARYDIGAKALDADPEVIKKMTPQQHDQMMRTLLASRFALKTHYETRPMPVYELVLAKGGAKVVPSKHGEHDAGWSWNDTTLKADGMVMPDFADVLTHQLAKPVLDKTGLPGRYDFQLKWAPDQVSTASHAGQPGVAAQGSDAEPPLFTAVQEQLGLRLQAAKDPVQVLVVDSIAPPSEN